MRRSEAYRLLDRIAEERTAARFALTETLRSVSGDVRVVEAAQRAGLTRGSLERCDANLDITYFIRLFAEFEGILLNYWQNGLGRTKRPIISVLISRIAALRGTSKDENDGVQEVREYRNDIVHEQLRDSRFIFKHCLNRLNVFLSRLPPQW